MDNLSREHYKAVWSEMQGRFFSRKEADDLKQDIDDRVVTDPIIRAEAAKNWGHEEEKPPDGQ